LVRNYLPVVAYLPASYIDREPLRLSAYRRIAETVSASDVDDATDELRDRFGPLPKPARMLLEVASLRADLRDHAITDVSIAPHELYGRVAKLRPVHLGTEERDRLRSSRPRAVVSEATETLLLPVPEDDELDLIGWLREEVGSLFARGTVPAES
jgi:transcription-repair coupling factor (superfamily II helicase)